jgi:S1-C subfamily serine protease
MEVDKERTSVLFENKALPSCNQNYDSGTESSVRIQFDIENRVGGWGSGNYLKIGHYKFILTAAHVVDEGKIYILEGENKIPATVLYKNTLKDIAIVVPDKELSIKAKSVKVNSKADLLGEAVNYTGFPSNIGRSTYTGFVANSDEDKMIMQSFALPGSSGSVVFDKKGRVLGVVSAVSVNQTALSPYPEIIEAVVFVERVKFLDKRFLKEVFMSAERNRHQK